MSNVDRQHGQALDATGGEVAEVNASYLGVVIGLAAAGLKLLGLAEQVRSTYRYLGSCSRRLDNFAEQMSRKTVDADTVNAHHDAAALLRTVLSDAEAMATATDELGVLFKQASEAHQGDYGGVHDTATSMPVRMAHNSFYANQ